MLEQAIYYLGQGVIALLQVVTAAVLIWMFVLWLLWVADHSFRPGTRVIPSMWPREDTPGYLPLFWLSWVLIVCGGLIAAGWLRSS